MGVEEIRCMIRKTEFLFFFVFWGGFQFTVIRHTGNVFGLILSETTVCDSNKLLK